MIGSEKEGQRQVGTNDFVVRRHRDGIDLFLMRFEGAKGNETHGRGGGRGGQHSRDIPHLTVKDKRGE